MRSLFYLTFIRSKSRIYRIHKILCTQPTTEAAINIQLAQVRIAMVEIDNWRLRMTIVMVEIIDWWLRMTVAMVEIVDWWSRMTIAMVQKTIEYWEQDRYGRNKDWWWKMMIERIENIEWRLVIENVYRWDWKYKLVIESWKGLELRQAGTSCEIIHSCLHQVASQFPAIWEKSMPSNGNTSSDEGKRILEKLQQKAYELSTPLGNDVAK